MGGADLPSFSHPPHPATHYFPTSNVNKNLRRRIYLRLLLLSDSPQVDFYSFSFGLSFFLPPPPSARKTTGGKNSVDVFLILHPRLWPKMQAPPPPPPFPPLGRSFLGHAGQGSAATHAALIHAFLFQVDRSTNRGKCQDDRCPSVHPAVPTPDPLWA